MRLAMIVEYDGTAYSGFQYQKNAPTVQLQIEKAIESLTAVPVRIKAAGRTDAGVHALGQVVAFDTDAGYPPATFRDALNARLPDDIAVKAAYRAKPDFDPRRDALSRLYRYTLLVSAARSPTRRLWSHRLESPPDVDSMRKAASLMEGTRDFSNFGRPTAPGGSTVRTIYSVELKTDGCLVHIEVSGNAFLTHQVRRMAGALAGVGAGRLNIEDVEKQISGAKDAPRARALPPQGLCLAQVRYNTELGEPE